MRRIGKCCKIWIGTLRTNNLQERIGLQFFLKFVPHVPKDCLFTGMNILR